MDINRFLIFWGHLAPVFPCLTVTPKQSWVVGSTLGGPLIYGEEEISEPSFQATLTTLLSLSLKPTGNFCVRQGVWVQVGGQVGAGKQCRFLGGLCAQLRGSLVFSDVSVKKKHLGVL